MVLTALMDLMNSQVSVVSMEDTMVEMLDVVQINGNVMMVDVFQQVGNVML
jgi:hypothetical protein